MRNLRLLGLVLLFVIGEGAQASDSTRGIVIENNQKRVRK